MKVKKEIGASFSFNDQYGNKIEVTTYITFHQSNAGGVNSWYEAGREYYSTNLNRPIGHNQHKYFQSPHDGKYYSPN